ncbi:MAG: hypothetical protein UR63_C0036G0004 [Candidatus Roizmanbacteria bacterium GW2011_GWC2_35_12]|uniref:Uncharacterized protein n=1 Tax=Candidatus Roizmanbacteria bacterium GW2011_GWC2_35_12 TaxID=1618485 RepID=A0A0G0BA48_9BACT|nr:MAG: hypothetical protein UR63_C0036G0004 [Candidatus Roizmanbacteria bacterium GW2011_GWC2_35_12]
MADAVTPEKVVLEAKHFAAGMIDRVSTDRDVVAMQQLLLKKDGLAVFTKEIEVPKDDVKEPDLKLMQL